MQHSSNVEIAKLVSSSHSIGSSPGGGFSSRTRIAFTYTGGNFSPGRAGGFNSVRTDRTVTFALRLSRGWRRLRSSPVEASRLLTCTVIVPNAAWQASNCGKFLSSSSNARS